MMFPLSSCFKVNSEAKHISKEIERRLKEDKRQSRSQVKLLVLGTAESGKSTFIKQMRIIHGKGYTQEEKETYICHIHHNIITSLKMLINAMENLGIEYESEENRAIAETLMESAKDYDATLIQEEAHFISHLWEDEGIQKCYLRGNEFHLYDSAAYYLNSIDRITAEAYVPSLQDILRTRVPTTGIVEYLFDVDRFIFGIVDVGGQKNERRKWIHCFESVTSIIFLAALSEYDQTIPSEEISLELRRNIRNLSVSEGSPSNNNFHKKTVHRQDSDKFKNHDKKGFSKTTKNPIFRHPSYYNERPGHNALSKSLLRAAPGPQKDAIGASPFSKTKRKYRSKEPEPEIEIPTINRLNESCALFQTIVQNQFFRNTSVILFLNKIDILEEKIKHSSLATHFPRFTGPEKDASAASEFILDKYVDCFENMKNSKRTLYTHFTCATDTNNIRFVFAAIKDIILQSYLVNYNLV